MDNDLKKFFEPKSIAVIGASNKPHSVGAKVFKNLISNGFEGKVYPVNVKHKTIQKNPAYKSIKDIQAKIDLAVISIPAEIVPAVVEECGEKGIKNIIVLAAGFSEIGDRGQHIEAAMLGAAKRYGIRIIGPNCLGVMQSHIKLNATFDNDFARPGNLAFVSQSGALSAAILDWSLTKNIGFSVMASLGNCADVGFADVINYLAHDETTKSILMYVEGIHNGPKFFASIRKASRLKPVIIVKAGRGGQGARAALSHTGAMMGNDEVFDAALKQAGAVRVKSIEDLFLAAEILSTHHQQVKSNKITIITNGGGAGVMAADCASIVGVELPVLNEKVIKACNKVLPPHWSHHNPIDIIGDAGPKRYHDVLNIFSKEQNTDAILTLLVPVAMAEPIKVAEQIVKDAKHSKKLIITSWMGAKKVESSRRLFNKNKIPSFDTPEDAIQAFGYLAEYHANQKLLKQSKHFRLTATIKRAIAKARVIIGAAILENRKLLTTIESKKILEAFAIPTSETINTKSIKEAVATAKRIGFPVVMKINSLQISHKKDVGGVLLNINNESEVKKAYRTIEQNVKRNRPKAEILGITIEPMMVNNNDRELIIGMIHDIVFGPVISFGSGGTYVEIIKDNAICLPPINKFLAKRLIAQTKISKALGKFRNMSAVHLNQIVTTIIKVSNLVCALPEIKEMDINPLIANDDVVLAVDARIVLF